MQVSKRVRRCLKAYQFPRKFFFLITCIFLTILLVGIPDSPITIISRIKKKPVSQTELLLPTDKAASFLFVNSCTEEKESSAYLSAADYNVVKSGLNVFKVRLAKEYKSGSKSFETFASRILLNPDTTNQSKTCLLPLKVKVDSNSGIDIKNSDLLEISLGTQSMFCSKGEAFVVRDSLFYPLKKSITSYAKSIKDKKTVLELKRRLAELEARKNKLSKAPKSELEQRIRKINLSMSYSQYFTKEAESLGLFFDALCGKAALVTTPNAKAAVTPTIFSVGSTTPSLNPTTPAGVVTPVKVTPANPIVTATPIISYGLSLPTFLLPAASAVVTPINGKTTIRWNAVAGATGYLIGAVNKTPPVDTDIFFNPNYANTSYELDILSNNSYRFWVRAKKTNYNPNDPSTFSNVGEVFFSVQAAVGSCGSIPNAGIDRRSRCKSASVPTGQSCQCKDETRTCNNGVFSEWSVDPAYTFSFCEPDNAEDLNQCASGSSNKISQYGITWFFKTSYRCGRFANGDYWVIPEAGSSTVTIDDIFPKTHKDTNPYSDGSMLNPLPNTSQGLYWRYDHVTKTDATIPSYDKDKNIALNLPYAVPANNSVYSVFNNPRTWPNPSYVAEKTYFKETAILTVLSSAPAAGSFRPPYSGTNKTIKSNWNVENINYSALQNYPIPKSGNAPSLTWLENATKRPLIELNNHGQSNSDFKASWSTDNVGGYPRRTYGREIAHISGAAGLMLNTNLSLQQKKKLAIYMIQWGIDTYALRKAGLTYWGQGGHQNGRLLPVYLAGKLLGDSEIMAAAAAGTGFSEHAQHFMVSEAHVSPDFVSRVLAEGMKPYSRSMLGMPEWCSEWSMATNNTAEWNPPISTYYRFVTGGENSTTAAVLLLMNARNEINMEAFIRYHLERFYPRQRPIGDGAFGGDTNSIPFFTRDMWDNYIKVSIPQKTYQEY